jgi:hypothetical protein
MMLLVMAEKKAEEKAVAGTNKNLTPEIRKSWLAVVARLQNW